MQCHASIRALLSRSNTAIHPSTTTKLSRPERLFLLGCISVGGVTGWQQKRFNANAVAVAHNRGSNSAEDIDDLPGFGRASRRDGQSDCIVRSDGDTVIPSDRPPTRPDDGGERDLSSSDQDRGTTKQAESGSHAARPDDMVNDDGMRGRGVVRSHCTGRDGREMESRRADSNPDTTTTDPASDEGSAKVQTPPRVRRLLSTSETAARLTYQEEINRQEREQLRSADQSSAFDEIVSHASAFRERDGRAKQSDHQSRMRQHPTEFPKSYLLAGKWRERQGQDSQTKRLANQAYRHPYKKVWSDEIWLNKMMKELNHATPRDPRHFVKIMEVVSLPEGVRAAFKGNVGEAVLELLQRTGSHVQLLPVSNQAGPSASVRHSRKRSAGKQVEQMWRNGFDSLTLKGTPSENAAALELLPRFVDAVTADDVNASRNLKDYILTLAEMNRFGSVLTLPDGSIAHETTHDWYEDPKDVDDRDYWEGQVEEQSSADDELISAGDKQSSFVGNAESSQNMIRTPVRAYWDHDRESLDRLIEPSNDRGSESELKFRRPDQWTTLLFTEYIDTLTSLPPRLVRRRLKSVPQSEKERLRDTVQAQTITEMVAVFGDRSAASSISKEAVDLAFRYLTRTSQYAAIRQIMQQLAGRTEYTLVTSNFDILLLAAAVNEDAHNFRLWLRSMVRQGLKPGWKTWANLHLLVCRRYADTSMPIRVLKAILEHGILNNMVALSACAGNGVEHDLRAFLTTKGEAADVMDFVKMYDERYAYMDAELSIHHQRGLILQRPWLTTPTANKMCRILLDHGRTTDAIRVIALLQEAGNRVNAGTLDSLLTTAARARDPSFMVEVLKHFAADSGRAGKGKVELSQVSWDLLLKTAWRRCYFNMVRVLWRYAVCSGGVSWTWQHRMRESLLSYVPAPGSRQVRESKDQERREREEAVAALKGSAKAKAQAALQQEEGLDDELTRNQLFFGWVSKFAAGVDDHVRGSEATEPYVPSHEAGFEAEETDSGYSSAEDEQLATLLEDITSTGPVTQHRRTGGSVDRHEWAPMTKQEHEILRLSMQPRTARPTPTTSSPPPSNSINSATDSYNPEPFTAHAIRKASLLSIFASDLQQTSSLRPILPLAVLLERARKKDMRWQARGLGTVTPELKAAMRKDVSDGDRSKVFAEVFGEMMDRGIKVPVVVGDVVKAKRRI